MLDPVEQALNALAERHLTLAVAEGDTGGALLDGLTAIPGSSGVVLGGVVAYHDDLKRGILGVAPDVLQRYGAVSAQVADAMARGIRHVSGADIGVATTGIAGPSGATPEKPVGLAFVAAASAEGCLVREHHWQGDRQTNRRASAHAAILLVLELMSSTLSNRCATLDAESGADQCS
jgi:PncC family amidohydrolase